MELAKRHSWIVSQISVQMQMDSCSFKITAVPFLPLRMNATGQAKAFSVVPATCFPILHHHHAPSQLVRFYLSVFVNCSCCNVRHPLALRSWLSSYQFILISFILKFTKFQIILMSQNLKLRPVSFGWCQVSPVVIKDKRLFFAVHN